jgi:molecular chaperone DnaJ
VVGVRKHPLFRREGNNLLLDLPIDMVQAALGDEIGVPTLDGGEVKLTVPPGTPYGKTFRIREQGVPQLRRNGRGDLLVTIQVTIPQNLTEKQRALLREFARTMGKMPAEPKGVLGKMKDALNKT